MPRDGEEESCSFPWLGFDPDSSAIALNHALANSQSDAGAGIFLILMEPFENTEDFLLVLGVDPYAVVLNRNTPRGASDIRRDVDLRNILASIFERVSDEILENLL